MILDISKVSLTDGSHESAIELYPGHEILSPSYRRMSRAKVLDRTIVSNADVLGLILDNGQKLTGSRDQEVIVRMKQTWHPKRLSDVRIGDALKGEKAGMTVIVKVIGLIFYPATPLRLVGFRFDRERMFVAEGVMCR